MPPPAEVTLLKLSGNDLFSKKDYKGAHAKYTAALKLPGGDQIPELFCNRAACSLHLHKYRSAIQDTEAAIALKEDYVKAWARMGQAHAELQEHQPAMLKYEKAVELLSAQPNLTAADAKLKTQYEKALATEKNLFDRVANLLMSKNTTGNLPWDVAEEMIPELTARGPGDGASSSAWAIRDAHKDFQDGLDRMDLMEMYPGGRARARFGAVELFSNAILLDERCFHLTAQWQERYEIQVMSEVLTAQGWADEKDEMIIRRDVKERLAKRGWEAVRLAMSTTFRGWVITGFRCIQTRGWDRSIDVLRRVISFIEWGRQEWPNATQEERGSIFEATWLIGVRNLYASILFRAYGAAGCKDSITCSLYDIETAVIELQQLLEATPITGEIALTHEPGFIHGFFIYPRAEVFALKGFVCAQKAGRLPKNSKHALGQYKEAFKFYMKAADYLPKDEEKRLWYRSIALNQLFAVGAPLSETLPVMESIRKEYPFIKPLWAISALSIGGRDERLETIIELEKSTQKKLAAGRCKLDEVVRV